MFVVVIFSFMPVDAIWVMQKFTGVDKAMEGFYARQTVPDKVKT